MSDTQGGPVAYESVISEPVSAGTAAEVMGVSLLDELKTEIANESPLDDTVSYPVPERPGFVATFRRRLVHEFVVEQTKRAVDADKQVVNELAFAARILIEYNVSFQRNGTVFRDDDSKPLSFRSAGFRDATNALTSVAAVQKFYKVDADIINVANELRRAAGYDRRIEEVDPTD